MSELLSSAFHTIPTDVKSEIISHSNLVELWNGLTPLGRNEWLCWIISAKKDETRIRRIERLKGDLRSGKRRPCCFAGCPHRKKIV